MHGEPFTAVGRIVKTHGLRGEVSVKPYAEASLSLLVGLEAWLVPPPPALRNTRIKSVRPGPKGPVVALEGVDSMEAAQDLSGCDLLVATDSLPDAFFDDEEVADVIGMKVVDEKRGLLGEVEDVIVTGANDVWVVRGTFGDVLIPVIDDVVLDYDEDSDTVRVALLPGLMPDESED